MKTTVLLLSAMTAGLSYSNAFAATDAQTLKQGRALSTVLSYLMPGIDRDAADKAAAFWTSKNTSHLEVVESGLQQVVLSFVPEFNRLRVERRQLDRKPTALVIEPGPMGDMVAHDMAGKILLSAKSDRGTVALIGPTGDLVAKVVPAFNESPAMPAGMGLRGLALPLSAR